MRRKKQEITDQKELEEILQKALVCRLAMSLEDTPYLVPLCFGYRDGTLYFHCAREGRKLDILRKNNRVCFECEVDTALKPAQDPCKWSIHYRSVIGEGVATLVEDSEGKKKALDIIMSHYSKGPFAFPDDIVQKTGIIKVEIAAMTGKRAV